MIYAVGIGPGDPDMLPHKTVLLLEKADVAVSPGNGFGKMGEGYVRISLVENKNSISSNYFNKKEIIKILENKKERDINNAIIRKLLNVEIVIN